MKCPKCGSEKIATACFGECTSCRCKDCDHTFRID